MENLRSFDESNTDDISESVVPNISVELVLSNNMHIMERKRYNIWDALGDIGGFHDGIYLLI